MSPSSDSPGIRFEAGAAGSKPSPSSDSPGIRFEAGAAGSKPSPSSGRSAGPPERRSAAALRYEKGADAPQVTAAGRGDTAERIVAAAEAAGVPVRTDPILAETLAQLDLESQIPPDLYRAVAEVLLWAWEQDRRASGEEGMPALIKRNRL